MLKWKLISNTTALKNQLNKVFNMVKVVFIQTVDKAILSLIVYWRSHLLKWWNVSWNHDDLITRSLCFRSCPCTLKTWCSESKYNSLVNLKHHLIGSYQLILLQKTRHSVSSHSAKAPSLVHASYINKNTKYCYLVFHFFRKKYNQFIQWTAFDHFQFIIKCSAIIETVSFSIVYTTPKKLHGFKKYKNKQKNNNMAKLVPRYI